MRLAVAGGAFWGYNRSDATKEIAITPLVPPQLARARRRSPLFLPFAAGCLLAACSATPPEPVPDYAARAVHRLARWQVLVSGEPRGELAHYEIEDPAEPVRFYRITDAQGRWLGHASDIGRFSRRVPFLPDGQEEDLGVQSMTRGIAMLLLTDRPVVLRPLPEAAEASSDR